MKFQIEEDERNRIDTIKKTERDKVNDEMQRFEENQKIQRKLAIQTHVNPPIKSKKTIFDESSSKSTPPPPSGK